MCTCSTGPLRPIFLRGKIEGFLSIDMLSYCWQISLRLFNLHPPVALQTIFFRNHSVRTFVIAVRQSFVSTRAIFVDSMYRC